MLQFRHIVNRFFRSLNSYGKSQRTILLSKHEGFGFTKCLTSKKQLWKEGNANQIVNAFAVPVPPIFSHIKH